jgi:endonuclease/exonuclease/phosphatase (EEP) superfamily protein YafD
MKFFPFVLFLSAALSHAADIPPDSKVLQSITDGAARTPVSTSLRLLNWNILKGERGDVWNKDIAAFAADRNVVLLQEGWQSPNVLAALQGIPGFSFTMANSFLWKGAMTGVVSGFTYVPDALAFRRSPQREPILNSPKMSLLASFTFADGRPLKIVNVHGINFVGPDKLKNQLDDVTEQLAGYAGTLVVAGDFNTWNDARAQVVRDFAKALGMTEVAFERHGTDAVLDHVFARGCAVEKAWVVENVASSDHDPEFVNFNCSANP